VLCLFASLEAAACEDGTDQSVAPFMKLDGQLDESTCTFAYLYTPKMNGADSIQAIHLVLGNEPSSVIPIDYGSAENLEGEFQSADHVVSELCLTAEVIRTSRVSAKYQPQPDSNGAIALCQSTREFDLSGLDGL
jgi:hypothetical protein